MTELVRTDIQGHIGILVADSPPVNALAHRVRLAILNGFDQLAGDDAVRAIVIMCAGRTFFAGADISELGKTEQSPGFNELFNHIEASNKPVIAAIHGTALGGGLELALACHFRLAVPSAKVGLPEVHLGILPGAGGTQRLPRLVGQGRALDMVMTGRTVGAEEALVMGLVNRIVQAPGMAAAKAYAREFSGYGLRALQFAREAVQRAADVPLHEGLRVEADLSTLAYRTRDAEEGMQAFVDKRKAAFRDE